MTRPPIPGGALCSAVLGASADAIITTDPSGIIASWNAAAEKLYGRTAAETVGQPIDAIVPPGRRDVEGEAMARVRAGEIVTRRDTISASGARTTTAVEITIAPVVDADGSVPGFVRIVRDISRGAGAEYAIRRLAAIVESSDDAIASKDLNGIVTSWNRSAERMFGYTADEMIGQSIRLLIPADLQSEEDVVLAKIRAGGKVEHFETIRRHKNGTLVPISLTVSPIRDDTGRVVGASKIARDISDRKQIEQERDRSLALAQEHAAITERLNHVGAVVASELDREKIVQAVTDSGRELTTAEFAAFFYNARDARGESYTLYTISGAPREAFSPFPTPRNTPLFGPTFHGTGIVRSDDITTDPRYGQNPPYYGMPKGHLPVKSYLAVPVKSRIGEVLGGLFFGHSSPARFTEQHERLASGVAAWASVALENAQLYVGVQEASRLKDEFLATLSHELRTPLNAILGYARMLRSGIIAAPKLPRAIETIERNATSLAQIVEDVLDVSRIISGKLRLDMRSVQVADVVRAALDVVAPSAEAKGVRVRTAFAPAPAICADPERLQQVIWNVLSNAVKFTPRGGTIDVRVEGDASSAAVMVSDSGVGIAPAFLPFIFERFRQADSGTNREHGGLGLGLGIARQLIELHGGTIVAESPGPGQGSTFRITLPAMVEETRAGAAARAGRSATRSFPEPAIPDLSGIRVLAVDDERDAASMVREILEATGAEVATAHSAFEALRSLETVRPHVLVADIAMPHMDGFELIARVRGNDDPILSSVPAAALTAYARSEDRARALRSGFQMHLAKPIDPAELMAAVATLAKGSDSGV